MPHAAAAPSNLDAGIPMKFAETELQNTRELRATASETAAPKPGSRRKSDKKTILKHFIKGILKGKLLSPKLQKSADKSLSQPGCSHSITIYILQLQKTIVLRMPHAAAAPSNLDAGIPMKFAETELQNTRELRATASETAAPKPGSRRKSDKKKTIFRRNFKRKITSAKIAKICWHINFATLKQPLQCVLQHHAATPNLSPHITTPNDNKHAAIPMRSATTASRNA